MSSLAYFVAWTLPLGATATSRALAGTTTAVVWPPGQRTQSWLGSAGVPSTATALSCDQYPEPACTSRTGPACCPN